MEIKRTCLILLLGALAASGYADVVNGQVDDQILYDASSINVADDLDIGWSAYAASEYDLSVNDIYSPAGFLATDGYWVGQIYTDNYQTYGNGTLSFDISYLTRGLTSSMFKYAIYGTDSTDSTDTAFSLTAESSPAGSAWTEIASGEVAIPSANSYEANFTSDAYKYLAVRFRFSGPAPNPGGLAADNISVVPEPAAIGLLALGGITTLIMNRRRVRKA